MNSAETGCGDTGNGMAKVLSNANGGRSSVNAKAMGRRRKAADSMSIRINFSAINRSSLLGRILRLPLRLLPRGSVVPILQGPLRGRRWIVGSSTHGCWLGSYENGEQKILQASIRPGSVVYDIGANVG